jgi:hypothetical protein
MTQRWTTNALGREIRVRDLERHPDRQCEVGEVGVVGTLVLEIDPSIGRRVLEPRVAKRIDGLDRRPDSPPGTVWGSN